MISDRESMVCPCCDARTFVPQDVELGLCRHCGLFTRGSLISGSLPLLRWCAGMCGRVLPADAGHGRCETCQGSDLSSALATVGGSTDDVASRMTSVGLGAGDPAPPLSA